ncbi:MAG: FkbM family methyltransferase [Sphingomonas sp.]
MSNLLRTTAEYVSRRITFKAHLPARFGRRPIYLSPGNHLAVLKPGDAKFEQYLLGFAERFVGPDDVVWDIGANMGMFAVPAAHRAKFTLCFEPDPFNLDLLHRTQAVNPDLRMDVLPVALADTIGIAKLAIPIRGRSANSLAGVNYGTQMGGVRQHYSVMTVPADWVLERYPAPTFIKCDAEGAETMILRGASKVLADARPVIVIEMPSANAKDCAAIFKANDYVTMSAYGPIDPANTVDDISETWDTLAIPQEKLAAMIGR